ncbi:outer membrane protein assembly factor BamA [Oleiagrimonas sp.]|jgi:outer membrane protein insertion porin family|uniref:outer membrane protein assembly factor BamA n=1 Tax=Oleiagrimonas sp. TaxID=2010330 RepID=UPI002632F303|nr:outer membrane protein assembly factor BamA [Oleiagrimonas sp.]MDA3914851.1 outer membrane protein assembly factor BamA [Oleiagrimonas sp.]
MKRIAALLLLASMTAKAMAMQPFVISDIRVDGLQRIAAGTVYSYLPISKGDTLTDSSAQEAIKALFQTGFFSDVELDRQGNILVIKVAERPSIAKLNIRGNKAIKTKDLKKGLKHIGLAEGDTYDPLALSRVQQELISQYYNRGKYNVSVKTHVTHLDRNRVTLDIVVREGKTARIKAINIVGNTAYSDKQIRKNFKSNTSNWWSWYSKDDQYSREKLSGDLKKLDSYYMNRGYADFNINSTEVSISPDKRKMYISADIKQGAVYKISDVHLLGNLILPEKTIRSLVFLHKGDVFNRYLVEQSKKAIKAVLSNIGYAFAKVQTVPKLDKKNRTVDMTFYIKPGERVYVRRINFHGNTTTQDSVLRREMRQPEGAWYSQAAIDASKRRLQTLGYFKDDVQIDTQRVPGTNDEVDLNVKVEEKSHGSVMFGVGYSQYSGMILSASLSQNNFLGSGDKFSVAVQKSSYYKQLQLSYVNPYLTDDGVSIGYNASFSTVNYGNTSFANYSNSTRSFSTTIGVPVSEVDRMNFSLGMSSNKINSFYGFTPQVLIDYQNLIGHYTIHSWTGSIGYSRDTRNYYWAPTRGGVQSLSVSAALPGSTVEYWKAMYHGNHYWPIGDGFVLLLDGEVGYGKTYGKDARYQFPFWENYYAGGVQDVRGFQDNTLGPRAPVPGYGAYYSQPIGGAFKVKGTAQMYLPIPALRDVSTARVAAFIDVGNVYKDYSSFNASDLRASVGLSLQWQAPIGPLVINFAIPVRSKPSDNRYKERIQFTFGNTF